MVDSIR